MAELAEGQSSATLPRSIPARTQLLAVAWLRWRLFVNNTFRRQQAGKHKVIGLLLIILLRAMVWTTLAGIVIGPITASGFFAWRAVIHHHSQNLVLLLAGIFAAWQFFSVNGLNVAANLSTFDPSSLARFPLPFGRYLLLRLLLGLLTPSTIVGCLVLLAAAIGIGIADHALAMRALVVLGFYALMSVFFTRMLAAWLERFLANRRYREAFGAAMTLFFIGIQFLNFHRTPTNSQSTSSIRFLHVLRASAPVLQWLPPGFATNSILLKGNPLAALAQLSGLVAFTGLFLVLLSIRLHKQFLGEYLSEGASRSGPSTSASRLKRVSQRQASAAFSPIISSALSPVIAACLRKERLDLFGTGNQLIALLTPLVFVVILGMGIFARHPAYFLPGAIGYVLLTLLPRLYNIFGADGNGVQLYLLAPVRLRDVILAKNIMSLSVTLIQTMLAWGVVMLLKKAPIQISSQLSAALWIVFVVAANLTVGTLRSIQAPTKFVPGRSVKVRPSVNRSSVLLVTALFMGSILLQLPVTFTSRYFGLPWLAPLIFAPLAGGAVFAYVLLLHNADRLILNHRDRFAEELCKD